MSGVGAKVLPFDGDTDAQQEVAATVRDGQPELPEVMVQELGRIWGEIFVAEYRAKHGEPPAMGKTGTGLPVQRESD